MDFLKKKRDFVDLIIKHIGTSAIMDLLLRLLTCIEPPQPRQDVLNVSRDLNCWGLGLGMLLFGPLGSYRMRRPGDEAGRELSQYRKDTNFYFIDLRTVYVTLAVLEFIM